MPVTTQPLPTLLEQAERLIQLDVHTLAGIPEVEIRRAVAAQPGYRDALLVISREALSPSSIALLLRLDGKPGFVVEDMTDLDDFTPIAEAEPPESRLYLVHRVDRGDDLANWSPNEALSELVRQNRTPLTVAEGIHLLLQRPGLLERNHCFMTVGSRLRKPDGSFDARTPALWISNGTGRDGTTRRNAPKVGWCWAGNRHTWLGFASAERRSPLA